MILTELAPLTPDRPSSTLSWMYCEKLKPMPDEFVGELLLQFLDQLFLGHVRAATVERLERHEELGIEEAGGVAAVVRAAVLRDDGDHFRVPQQDLRILLTIGMPASSDMVGGIVARIQRLPSSSAGRKFRAEPRRDKREDQRRQADADRDHDFAVCQRPAQDRRIGSTAARARRSVSTSSTCSGSRRRRGPASP